MPNQERRVPIILQVPQLLATIEHLIEPTKEMRLGDHPITVVDDDCAKRLYTLSICFADQRAASYAKTSTLIRNSEQWRKDREDAQSKDLCARGCMNFFWARLAQIDPILVDYHMNSLFVCQGWVVCTDL